MKFINLHGHSCFSIFDGYGYPQDHIDYAIEKGMNALALTDHGNMNGLSYQYLHSQKINGEGKTFKPIFGVEGYFIPSIAEWKEAYDRQQETKKTKKQEKDEVSLVVEDEVRYDKNILRNRSHIVLLAQNLTGLHNIFKLVSESYKGNNFYYFPRIDLELLRKYNEGVIVLSGCLGGTLGNLFWGYYPDEDKMLFEFDKLIKQFKEIFGNRFYAELQWHDCEEQLLLNQYIIHAAIKHKIKLVTTLDVHYPRSENWIDREIYKRIRRESKDDLSVESLPKSEAEAKLNLHIQTGDEIFDAYQFYKKKWNYEFDDQLVMNSIEEAYHIGNDLIEDVKLDTSMKLPSFICPADKDPNDLLREHAIAGLQNKNKYNDEYIKRLERELGVIREKDFAKYFLTMEAIVKEANKLMLCGPARGSAGGSLIAYLIGITQVDPIRFGLQFERFLTKNSKGMPDIDFDVADRMELVEHLINLWGENTVVPISNFNTLQLRSLVKDISKFYDISFKEVNEVTSKMMDEATVGAKAAQGIKAGVYVPTYEEVLEYSNSLKEYFERYPKIQKHVKNLIGMPRSISRHAGGIAVADNLDFNMPLIASGKVIQTPWCEGINVRHLEPLGFIKFDILGLSTLLTIQTAIKHLLNQQNIEPSWENVKNFYDKNLHPDSINFDDSFMWEEIFNEGKFVGLFQFTQNGVQNFLKKVHPTSIDELSNITAIYRPGPLGAGVDEAYIEAKQDPKYIHNVLKSSLEKSAGLLVYQEQVAEIAYLLGDNISLDEGNNLRKALSKTAHGKKEHEIKEIISKLEEEYYERFESGSLKKGLTKKQVRNIWNEFCLHSKYSFNRSHSLSYAIISYQCAYLLKYYPIEWCAAFLEKEPEDRKFEAISLVKELGINILPIDINLSSNQWEILDNNTIIQPLTSIKGLGEAAVEQIINNRPYNNLDDLIFNDNILYSKLNKKVFDILIRIGALDNLIQNDDRIRGTKHLWHALVDGDRPKTMNKFCERLEQFYNEEPRFTKNEKIEFISQLTGAYPLEMVIDRTAISTIESCGVVPISEFDPNILYAWFIPIEVITKTTAKGKLYFIIKVIDRNYTTTEIKCWGIRPKDVVELHKIYVTNPDFDEKWGFSCRGVQSLKKIT